MNIKKIGAIYNEKSNFAATLDTPYFRPTDGS